MHSLILQNNRIHILLINYQVVNGVINKIINAIKIDERLFIRFGMYYL